MRQWIGGLVIAWAGAVPAAAQVSADMVRQLGDVLRMDTALQIMAREAEASTAEVAPQLFGGAVPGEWSNAVTELFDPIAARAAFDAGLTAAVANSDPDALEQAIAFFESPLGAQVLTLELSAREALLDKAIEAAAMETWADLQADPMPAGAARAALIEDVVAAGDLVEANVSSALNGNLAFLQGLAEAGGFSAEMSQDEMLAQVRAQEADVRAQTEEWLYPYLVMAYAPLTDDELRIYVDFAASPVGKTLNGVLLLAFDAMTTQQSRGMGLAAGKIMAGQDI